MSWKNKKGFLWSFFVFCFLWVFIFLYCLWVFYDGGGDVYALSSGGDVPSISVVSC